MKTILRYYIIEIGALYLVSKTASGMVFEKGLESLLLAGVGLTVISLLIKPVVNILLLPINLITFGLFRWVSAVVALYLVLLLVPGFKILGFSFPGYHSNLFSLPSLNFSGFLAIIAFSFTISVSTSLIHWLIK